MKRWLTRLLLLAIGAVVAALALEAGLRIAGVSYPNFYRPDDYRGFAHRSGAQGWWRKEGNAFVQINSEGLRDREHSKTKPPNTVRVAVLGDSMIEALQVPLDNTACAVLERELRQCSAFAGKNVEVINFGVSSYGTAQELLTLRQQAWAYSPDIVILAFTTANDLNDNSPALAQDADLRPFFVYPDGHLVLDSSFQNSPRFRRQQSLLGRFLIGLKNRSRLAQVLNEFRAAFLARKGSQTEKLIEAYDLAYCEPTDSVWSETWRVTEGMIKLMRDEVKEKGAEFLVVTLTNDWQVHPDPATRAEFARRMNVPDLLYPDRRIKALGAREGFAVLNLAPALQAYAEQHKVYLHGFGQQIGFGHWNIEGNKLAGETIARYLCEERSH